MVFKSFSRLLKSAMSIMEKSDYCVNFKDSINMFTVVFSMSFLRHVMSEDFKDLTTYPMDHYCGGRLGLDNVYQFVVQFESDNIVLPEYVCNLTFTQSNNRELRMAVRVVNYMNEGISDCSQRLVLHDFSTRRNYIICSALDDYKLSGHHYVYLTWTNSLLLKYVYGSKRPQGSFKIVVTLFHEGQCGSDEVRCSNGYCIKHTIYCNGHSPCGDESESCGDKINSEPNSATSIILSVLIPVGLLAFVGAVLYGYCCRNTRCRNSEGSESQTSRFWFNAFTSRGATESEGVTNEGANFDEPPDYDSLSPSPPASTVECPPPYNEVIKDTVKYKVNDNTPDTIVFV